MNINEFQLGDWYQSYNGDKLYYYKVEPETFIGSKETLDSFMPVNITKELLEKNGFSWSKDKNCYVFSYRCDTHVYIKLHGDVIAGVKITRDIYSITEGIDYDAINDSVIVSFGWNEIRYVHKLQQLYRLCNINYEIKVE